MKNFAQFREEALAKAFLVIAEKEMSPSQMKKREEIAQSMDDSDFKKRYGKDWKSVKMATATKQAMKEEQDTEEVYIEHMCAKHVYHDVYGEGVVVEGEHAVPDEEGNIEWYTVEFPHGKETVFTEDVMVMHERYHGHKMKKKKMNEIKEPMNPQTRDYYEGPEEEEDEDEEEEKKKPNPNQKKKMSESKLDELKDTTLRSYERKAMDQRSKASTAYRSEVNRAQSDGDDPNQDYLDSKKKVFSKRSKGVNAVRRRLNKEEVEDVEETVKHPNQQVLDVHEPEKDKLTAKDFEMLRKMKKAKAK